MSNVSSLTTSALVSAESLTDKEKAKAKKFEDRVTKELPTVSSLVSRSMRNALVAADEAAWNSPVTVTIGAIDALARALRVKAPEHHGEGALPFGTAKGKKVLPTDAERIRREVFDLALVGLVAEGEDVFLNSSADMDMIRAMPDGKSPLRDAAGKVQDESGIPANPDESAEAREIRSKAHKRNMRKRLAEETFARANAARRIVAATWFCNGRAVPSHINPPRDTSGRYIGATQAALVPNLQTTRKHHIMMLEWFFVNQFAMIRDFALRNHADDNTGEKGYVSLTADDMSKIESKLAEQFGGKGSSLAIAYQASRPKAERAEADPMQKLRDKVKDIKDLDALRAFVLFAQQTLNERVASVAKATEGAGLAPAPEADDTADDLPDIGEDTAEAA